MDARVMTVLSTSAVFLLATPAGANPVPIQVGTMVPHYAEEIAFSTDPPEGGWARAYEASPVTSRDDLNLRIDVVGSRGVVWYVLAVIYDSTEVCGVEVGLGSYEAAAFLPITAEPCFPGQGFEVAGEGWPGPMTGTLLTSDLPWAGVWVPVYAFAGYAYSAPGPTVIPLSHHPSTGYAGFFTCTSPPVEHYLTGLGSLGINADGSASTPMEHRVCCHDDFCTVEAQVACLTTGGVWRGELGGCELNPCDKGACCVPNGCEYVWEDSCHALHPEITGEFVPGEIWHPSGNCDPGSPWCYPSPTRESSWGTLKLLYREP